MLLAYMLTALLIGAFPAQTVAAQDAASQTTTNGAAVTRYAQVRAQMALALQSVERYRTSHALSDLQAAVDAMDGSLDNQDLTPENVVTRKRDLVRTWAPIIAAIESAYEPNYDPNAFENSPVKCPKPPGWNRPGCVGSPSNIRDPAERAIYIQELKVNDLKNQRWERYNKVSLLEDDAMATLEISLKTLNTAAPPGTRMSDISAIDEILRQAGVTKDRRQQIERAAVERF